MHWRLGASTAMVLVSLVTPLASASTGTVHVTISPGGCPASVTAFPKDPNTLPWMDAAYRARFTARELAYQVYNCEKKLRPAETAFYAEVAMVGLNKTPNFAYENQNMWLADTAGTLTAQTDFSNLGIPALSFEDGPNGIYYHPPANQNQPTIFPNEMALAASMSPTLAEQYGAQLSAESASFHYMGVQSPDLNLDRIPNWGRSPETFGEDPVLAGEMGAQEAIGILQSSPIVVLKHFGLYGQDTNRKVVNFTLTGNAMFDTYLRPFFIVTNEVAASSAVPAHRQVTMMCSYGDVNGVRSCISGALRNALTALPYSGIVRSDLDTVTPAFALLHAGVQLVKPLDVTAFSPYNAIPSLLRTDVAGSALRVLELMFAANLVNPADLAASKHLGILGTALHANGITVANLVEARGAVLLKNNAFATPGSLPVTSSESKVAIVAPSDLSATCRSMATDISAMMHNNATCTLWSIAQPRPTVLMAGLPNSPSGLQFTASRKWTAPLTGPFVISTGCYGETSLFVDGKNIQNEPGFTLFYDTHYVNLDAVKGHTYNFTATWQNVAPTVSISSMAPAITAAVKGAAGASMVIALAHDLGREGMDRTSLALPYGQDSVIRALAAAAPTSVGLITTGPVLMPWLSLVDSVIEFWNSVGNLPVDSVANGFTYTYSRLLDGHLSPSGHLPITFPADENQSPMSIGNGPYRWGFWPGVHGIARLNYAPVNGSEIGYQWYRSQNWPVLFPFGWGLTYATMKPSIDTGASCPLSPNAQAICIPLLVNLTNDHGLPARTALQIYVAQPNSTANPRVPLVFGGFSFVNCRDSNGLTGQCNGTTDFNTTISALDVGAWSTASSSFQFLPGCYSFVVANDEANAMTILANGSPSSQVVHATAPFSSATTLIPGACR